MMMDTVNKVLFTLLPIGFWCWLNVLASIAIVGLTFWMYANIANSEKGCVFSRPKLLFRVCLYIMCVGCFVNFLDGVNHIYSGRLIDTPPSAIILNLGTALLMMFMAYFNAPKMWRQKT